MKNIVAGPRFHRISIPSTRSLLHPVLLKYIFFSFGLMRCYQLSKHLTPNSLPYIWCVATERQIYKYYHIITSAHQYRAHL